MKPLLFCLLFCAAQPVQANDSLLVGKWKFVKMEVAGEQVFNLDDLLSSYKLFYKKQQNYNANITAADSLNIQRQFEKMVNDINKMFVEFKANHRYETNKYGKDGNMLSTTETGTYDYNRAKKQINTYVNGSKQKLVILKLIAVSINELKFQYSGPDAPVFTCRRVDALPILKEKKDWLQTLVPQPHQGEEKCFASIL